MYLFINYPKCSTCRKAKNWLDSHGINYESRDVSSDVPSTEEIKKWSGMSQVPLKKFFNSCSAPYKELNLKDKLSSMNDEEQINILSSNGMLLKRPLLVSDDMVLVGFKAEEWEAALKND